ncbi:MAG: DUF3754 domain-containing protein [Thermoguttaceae bacterium]|nr:DUF3754 domain-containing protein [Thermoguttaceae bacterium]
MLDNLKFLDEREYFIPIRTEVLLDRILADTRLSSTERENFRILTEMLSNRFHFEYYKSLQEIKKTFVPFDPDREMLWEPDLSDQEKQEYGITLINKLRELLKLGNFTQLSQEQLNQCLHMQPYGGLSVSVDTSDFSEFNVFYRGIRKGERRFPKWKFWKRQPVETVILKRVYVIACYKQEQGGNVIIKLFKDVPVENIKIIAPKVHLGLPVFDRVKIGGTVFGGLITSAYKLFVAAALSWVLFIMVLAGFLLALLKGVFGFMNSRTKYMQIYSSSLYDKSLSNNNGALTSLIYMVEEQEIKETLLAYYILYVEKDQNYTIPELDKAIETWLARQFNINVDFEIGDALRKLIEKDIIKQDAAETAGHTSREILKVFDLPETLRRLDEAWDHFYSYNRVL